MKEFWFNLLSFLMLISPSVNCPNRCICMKDKHSGVVIDCSKLGMVTFPPDSNMEDFEQNQTEFNIIDLSQNHLIQVNFPQKYQNVERINLAFNEIATMKNVTINDVKSLREIDLSHNKKLKKMTIDLKSKSVEILILRNCSINEIAEGFLENFPSLRYMDISQNSITTINYFHPLDIENFKFDIVFFPPFEKQYQLTHFNISHNQLIKIPGKSFLFTKIKILDISNNKISDLRFTIYLPRLKELYASRNNLINLNGLSAKKLIYLDISGNKLIDAHYDFNINTPSLKSLIMSYNNIEKIIEIKSSSIMNLDISYSHVRIIESKAFSRLKKLQILNLAGNELTSAPGEFYLELTNLVALYIEENPWDCDCSSKEFKNFYNFVLFEKQFTNGRDLQCWNDTNKTWSIACENYPQNDDFVISERGAFYTLLYIFSAILILIILAACYKYIMNVRRSDAITFDNDNGVVNHYSVQAIDDSSTVNTLDYPVNFPTRRSTPPPNYEAALMLPVLTEEERELAISTLSLNRDS